MKTTSRLIAGLLALSVSATMALAEWNASGHRPDTTTDSPVQLPSPH